MRCSSCGSELPVDSLFCEDCGSAVARTCPSCGTLASAGKAFCRACGNRLDAVPEVRPRPDRPGHAGRSERAGGDRAPPRLGAVLRPRRLHAVLGENETPRRCGSSSPVTSSSPGPSSAATAASSRSSSATPSWRSGAPRSRKEDDAERAVRGRTRARLGRRRLRHRARTSSRPSVGVVTGGVATTRPPRRASSSATCQHRRAHPVGGPARVLLGRRDDPGGTAAAIAYVDAGEHELKGKAEPVRLSRATAGRRGRRRLTALGGPRGALHRAGTTSSASSRSSSTPPPNGSRRAWCSCPASPASASPVSPGSSSSTSTAWPGDVLWHAGRCLSYGEGVSYWALSEMVRGRGSRSARRTRGARRRATAHRPRALDLRPADREFIAPRLGQLLGLPSAKVLAKEELFSGWRLFFERLAEYLPVVMVVEDLQWAETPAWSDSWTTCSNGAGSRHLPAGAVAAGGDRPARTRSVRRSVTALPLDRALR